MIRSMPRQSSLAIANEFLHRAHDERRRLTHMQLQKLVYLAQGWGLAVTGQKMMEEDFEAWEFGPVIRRLYDALRAYGRAPIPKFIRWGDDTPFPSDDDDEEAIAVLTPQEKAVLDKVWDTYKGFEAFQLSALTHAAGSPWHQTYEPGKNRVINPELIWEYFARLAARHG